MSTPDVRAEILRIFRDALNIDLRATDVDIIEAGILDSLAFVTLLYEIEQRWGVALSFDTLDIDDFRTVESIAAVTSRLSGHPA
jgi:acyl carrier protein